MFYLFTKCMLIKLYTERFFSTFALVLVSLLTAQNSPTTPQLAQILAHDPNCFWPIFLPTGFVLKPSFSLLNISFPTHTTKNFFTYQHYLPKALFGCSKKNSPKFFLPSQIFLINLTLMPQPKILPGPICFLWPKIYSDVLN